ncbi:TAXI family TRAP transporter solute-binding subunit [Alkalicoccobacillus porphyridii]|uniref:TAXI family TRAP transporter solute-binding subunit n=1 Tax=Alkalicoccobacillus porphyridii TaxID=2597270 RepID=A0A554A198_9BACI|nr:TAXI family TRAP transporter solute-binding subunit [Alkalicoccobacillus porphyridii]TSB47474.1 TAXI family TRAP transporter solute-binding subunit [Alkalicoccobacillus porphyridii]
MRKNWIALLMTSLVIFVLAACGSGNDGDTASGEGGDTDGLESNLVTIATGGASGPYNIIGTTLADNYSNTFDVNSRTQTTGASAENLNLLADGKVEMAFVMSDALSQALEGEASFSEPLEGISQVANLYPNVVQIVARADAGIETLEDLKGKRIAVGDQGSGVELNARALLNGNDITYDDVQVDYLGYAEAADGLNAGRIDAAFLTSGLPNASVLELSETLNINIVKVLPEQVEAIVDEHPYFVSLEIPEGTYDNEEAIPTAAVPNALVVRSDLSDDDVYKLTKEFFENLDTLANSHQAASEISIDHAQEGLIAPLHPGAEQYFDEQ